MKIITVFFALCLGNSLLSQVMFPENDAVWREVHFSAGGSGSEYFGLCGDTIIDGNHYSKVLNLDLDSALNVVGENYSGAIRSDGDLILFKPNFEFDEYVLFDFSLEQGDVIDLYLLYYEDVVSRTVDSVKNEMLAGKMRKVIYFNPIFPGADTEYWIEGIGSSYGLLSRGFSTPSFDLGFLLLCFKSGDEYLNLWTAECLLPELNNCSVTNQAYEVSATNFFSIAPNPTSETVRISCTGGQFTNWEIELLNFGGHSLKRHRVENANEFLLDMIGQLPGIYFLRIMDIQSGPNS